MDAFITVTCIVLVVVIFWISGYIATSLFPHETVSHLVEGYSWVNIDYFYLTFISMQHGFIYKPYVSIPIFMFFLWFGTTGLSILYHANELVEDDTERVGSGRGVTGFLPRWTWDVLRPLDTMVTTRPPGVVERIICARITCLWWVVTMPLAIILPFGNGFAYILALIGFVLIALGLLVPLALFVVDVRLMAAFVAVVQGARAATHSVRESAHMSKADAPKPGQKAIEGEVIPPSSDTPFEPAGVPAYQPAASSTLKNVSFLAGRAYVQRLTKRQQEKLIEAEAAVRAAMAKLAKTNIKLERTLGMQDDIDTIKGTDADNRAADARKAKTARAEAEHEADMRELARAREYKEALEKELGAQTSTADASNSADPFMSELEKEFAPSPAQKARDQINVMIGKMLDGLPENKAPAALQQRIAEMRGRCEQMIKDQGLE